MPALAAAIPDYIDAITIVADADDAGRKNARKLAKALAQQHHGEVRVIVPPQMEGAAA
jgi:hypothetical protein